MSIFSRLHYAQPVETYVGAPIQAIDQLGADLQNKYYTNLSNSEKLLSGLDALDVEDRNREIVEGVKEKARKRIEQMTADGAYEHIQVPLGSLANEIANDRLLSGALKSKIAKDAYEKKLTERVEKGEVLKPRSDFARQYNEDKFSEAMRLDENGNVVGSFNGYIPQKFVDVNDKAIKFADKIKANKTPTVLGKDKKGNPITITYSEATKQYYVTGETKGIDEEEAKKMIIDNLSNDPEVSAYINEEVMVRQYKAGAPTLESIYTDATGEPYDDAKAEKIFSELGLDKEKVRNDPEMLKLIDANLKRKQIINDIASPISRAVSFSEEERKLTENKDYSRAQDFNYAIKKMQKEQAYDLDTYSKKKEIDKVEEAKTASAYRVSNTGRPDLEYQPSLGEANLQNTEMRLRNLKGKIEAKQRAGQVVSPEELNQLRELEKLKLNQESAFGSYMGAAADSAKGTELLNRYYQEYKKEVGDSAVSFDDFKEKVINKDYEYGGGLFSSKRPTPGIKHLERARQSLIEESEVQKQARAKIEAPQSNVLTSSYRGTQDTKDYLNSKNADPVDRFSQAWTNAVITDSSNFVLSDGTTVKSVLDDAKESAGDKWGKYNIIVSPKSLRHGNQHALELTVQNEKGETVISKPIRAQDQQALADSYATLNKDIVATAPPDSKIAKEANLYLNDLYTSDLNEERDKRNFQRFERNEKAGANAFGGLGIIDTPQGQIKIVPMAKNVSIPVISEGKVVGYKTQKKYFPVQVVSDAPDMEYNETNILEYVAYGTLNSSIHKNPNLVADDTYRNAVTKGSDIDSNADKFGFNSYNEMRAYLAALNPSR